MSAAPEPRPLAERMRPATLEEWVGQPHLLGAGRPLRQAILAGRPYSMILWGPPGCGKTTLARLIASYAAADVVSLSAVLAGVKEIRASVEQARNQQAEAGRRTILFVDEVHRFNKAQQDALLPHIEAGTLLFIGATTENPAFALNNALLSRLRVHVLQPVSIEAIGTMLDRAISDRERGLGSLGVRLSASGRDWAARQADGDIRRALNLLETAAELATDEALGAEHLAAVSGTHVNRFDQGGDIFYDQISALHKALRGSDPDAGLYWLCRMLAGGCDPEYLLRRLVRIASEDIGNADPRALSVALNAWDAFTRLGQPEGELAIAQAVTYLACAPKSNAVYQAFTAATQDAAKRGDQPVPVHLRNAPTRLAKQLGHGHEYRYSHDEPDAFSAGQSYFPADLRETIYYEPVLL